MARSRWDSKLREVEQKLFDQQAAMGWSTEYDMGRAAVAQFGDEVWVNGDPVDMTFNAAKNMLREEGYRETEEGGKIPVTEACTSMQFIIDQFSKKVDVSYEEAARFVEEKHGSRGLFDSGEVCGTSSGKAATFVKENGGILG